MDPFTGLHPGGYGFVFLDYTSAQYSLKLAHDSARDSDCYSQDGVNSESMRQKDMRSPVFLSTNIPETSTTWHSMLVLIKEYVSKKLKTTYLTVNEGFL